MNNESVVIEEFKGGRLARVSGWTLAEWKRDKRHEPRIHDLDLGKRLGYKRPRKIRELIKNMIGEGKLSGLFCPAAGQNGRGRPAQEYWLTESEALKVAAKSETDEANKILDEIIYVYMLARRGLLPQQNIDVSSVAELRELIVAQSNAIRAEYQAGLMDLARQGSNLQAQIVALQNSHESGVVGPRMAKAEINAPLTQYARLMARVDLSQPVRAHCSRAHNDLRDEIEYPAGEGADWRYLPREKFGKAQRVIRKMLSRALKALDAMHSAEVKKVKGRQTEFKYNSKTNAATVVPLVRVIPSKK